VSNNERTDPENIMSTYAKILTMNAPELALANLESVAEKFNAATENLTAATKAMLMLAGVPLLGLAFVLALPVISVALTVYYTAKLTAARWAGVAHYVKNVALFFAAPFVGLAYILALPFVGVGMLCYLGLKAARR
jgi:hypothetical protein